MTHRLPSKRLALLLVAPAVAGTVILLGLPLHSSLGWILGALIMAAVLAGVAHAAYETEFMADGTVHVRSLARAQVIVPGHGDVMRDLA